MLSLAQLQRVHPSILAVQQPAGFPGLDLIQLTVTGSEAHSTWQGLRNVADELKRWPVIVGNKKGLKSIADYFRFQQEHGEPGGTLLEKVREWIRESEQTQFPEWLRAQRDPRRRIAEYLEMADRMAAMDGPESMIAMYRSLAAEIEAAPPSPPFDPANCPWSEDETGSILEESAIIRDLDTMEFANNRIVKEGDYYTHIELILLPTTAGWEAPAWLGLGGFNGCPFPPVHAAFARWAFENYQAEVVTVSHDVLELAPRAGISSRNAALQLAHDLQTYGEELNFGGQTIQEIASALMRGSLWSFWWD